MAEASFSQDQFSCSVCLDLLKDPVTIPCGHSYCMSCITDCWKQKRVYRCPQCRHTFTSRPALCKNVIIAEMVEKLKTTDLQTAEPGDVECDVCTGKKYKAVKSCVECLNSYCQSHFEQHENLFKDRRHNLMDPIRRLHEMICPKHNKQLEIYCRTDQQFICFPCLIDEHKNHDTVTAEAERTEKQRLLGETQRKFQQGIQERQNQLQELRDAVKSHKRSAQAAVDDTERIFTQLTRSIERSRSQVIQLIRAQEEAAVSRAEGLLLQLEKEIDDLMSRNAELEQLLHTDDHVHFLQMFQYIAAPPESTDLCSITVSSFISFHDVANLVSQLKEKLEGFCKEEVEKIFDSVTCIDMTTNKPMRTREQFLQYSCQLTLDSNTMNRFLRLSEENSVATCTDTPQHYPAHPDRFDGCVQVFCKESVCGRYYWEVEWSGRKSVCISVSYKSISRKQFFGFNNQCWSLFCSSSSYIFRHNNIKTELPVSSRIGVYVDHSVGILSFYSVSDTMSLIHRIQTTFTEPLYPGFGFDVDSSVKLCHLIM
ncbi:tripartite motif-containing protein 16 [Sinocyclocheilus anshuiensis]|uniref:tripartite motif-containing protein 16 n=1 Tax=Sinocyclocheilus anshuiensis TaxID=1608454 RepID=UPI0007B7ADEA|nr:PREDICTED: tripartite motif-containing protein 16-like [Sinocyclocheilus anshuiensis]